MQQPKLRWISIGAAGAIITWVVGSALFRYYIAADCELPPISTEAIEKRVAND